MKNAPRIFFGKDRHSSPDRRSTHLNPERLSTVDIYTDGIGLSGEHIYLYIYIERERERKRG